MDGVRHYLVDELDPSDEFHVVRFVEMAKQALKEITANGQIPIVVGGTGFYIQALLYDIDFTEQECDSAYRRQLEELAETRGNHYLHEMLKAVDPASAEAIHENNRKRVIRALNFTMSPASGSPSITSGRARRHPPTILPILSLNDDREKLYRRIDARVDAMVKAGLCR